MFQWPVPRLSRQPPTCRDLQESRSVTTATPRRTSTHMSGLHLPERLCGIVWLSRLIADARLLFESRRECWQPVLAFGKISRAIDNFTWLVNEIPAVVALGHILLRTKRPPSAFHRDYSRLGEADILLASGVLQVLEDWNGFLRRAASLPRHLLINRTPVGDQPDAVTLCAIGVSFNPYRIFNRRSFIATFVDLGYRLADEWQAPENGCRIPDHPSHSIDAFSGFYFVLDRPGPAGAQVA